MDRGPAQLHGSGPRSAAWIGYRTLLPCHGKTFDLLLTGRPRLGEPGGATGDPWRPAARRAARVTLSHVPASVGVGAQRTRSRCGNRCSGVRRREESWRDVELQKVALKLGAALA
eukprot:760850-Hanusia_phi.AAC.1